MRSRLSIILVLFFVCVSNAHAAMTCVALHTDLSYGNTDSSSGGPIRELQNYLIQAGYLTATANGHFGLGTKSAVQAFQAANGISQTGTVGPVTRAALQQKSCATSPTTSPVTPTALSPAVTPTPVTSTAPAITSPVSGSTLTIGKTYPISWNVPTNYPYNIILEQPGGAGAGFIATNLSGGSGYSWKGGNIFSSGTQTNQNVATGTYRIRIQSTTGGVSSTDPVSGWFTLVGPPLQVSSVTPSVVANDAHTAAVVYGTGFDPSSIVYFDQQYGTGGTVLYVSPDGTVIVFSVPSVISPGYHSIFVGNQYGSISNTAQIIITASTQ